MGRAKYEIKQAKNANIYPGTHGWYWRLVAGNGEVLCVGEMHPSKSNAKRAAKTARRNSRFAKIV